MTSSHPGRAAAESYFAESAEARRRLVVPLTVLVIVFFFLLPTLTNFTPLLDGVAFSGLSWAYLYAFAQFAMVLVVTSYYRRRMDAFEVAHRPPVDVHPVDKYDTPKTGSDAP